ncbi:MAG: hypothetical protein JRH20_20405, partial [Deltaproteobacteria bacterium]|nr:hypothetical protein [Deltaproteobacteria bacterium]
MTTKVSIKGIAIFAWAIFAMACGDSEQSVVRAINLQTGQQQEFSFEDPLPPGWGVCPDGDCSVLPGVPCQNLGEALCGGTPGCELVQLGCSVSACAAPAP